MYHIRTTQTASSKTAIQVVRYEKRKTIVVKHVGSAGNPEEVLLLKRLARKWIETKTLQGRLFPDENETATALTPLQKYRYLGVRYFFVYEIVNKLFFLLGFHQIRNRLLLDLALIRLIEPTSKLRSLVLLQELFGISYSRSSVYRSLPLFLSFKERVEQKAIAFARKQLNFDFTLVFYDVTTLYFETDRRDDLRQSGFSKDNKFNQPQILIGIIVNIDGFPLAFEVFEGKRFEGHTLLPVICRFKDKYPIGNLTVVADAAMLSLDNVGKLVDHGLSYIVGARVGSLPLSLIKTISAKLNRKDGQTLRLPTEYGFLVCDFSVKRHRKDKHEMDQQIKKVVDILNHPAKDKKPIKIKFLRNIRKTKYCLNQKLVDKTKLLLGIKGYYTNLDKVGNQEIIKQYHNLWRVEKAFRIAKSDLRARPIYHFRNQTIQAHILICFMALCVAKYIEITTGKSVQSVLNLLKSVTDARMLNTVTNQETTIRCVFPKELKQLLKTMSVSY